MTGCESQDVLLRTLCCARGAWGSGGRCSGCPSPPERLCVPLCLRPQGWGNFGHRGLWAEKPREQGPRGKPLLCPLLELHAPTPRWEDGLAVEKEKGRLSEHHLPRVSHVVAGRTEVSDFWKRAEMDRLGDLTLRLCLSCPGK